MALTRAQEIVLDLQQAIDAIVEAWDGGDLDLAIRQAIEVADAVPHDRGRTTLSSQHYIDTGRYVPQLEPDTPDMIVMLVDQDDDPDDPEYLIGQCVFVCPNPACGAVDKWYEVDESVRWNEIEIDFNVDRNGDSYTTLGVNQADGDYETVGWKCEACEQQANMPHAPEFYDVTWG